MKAQKKITGQSGFTLLETMMAMAIFTVGILGLFGMQSAAIKENLSANAITSGSIWAADRVERLLGLEYETLNETHTCADLPKSYEDLSFPYDTSENNGVGMVPCYTVYWAIANDCLLENVPEDQKPKYIKVIVTKSSKECPAQGTGTEEDIAVYDYIKQNTKND
ncbi:MAG: prepilin-type N-terminal cleavage/methylation domain-containing protein [Candidatus Electrothrix sp. YB6]